MVNINLNEGWDAQIFTTIYSIQCHLRNIARVKSSHSWAHILESPQLRKSINRFDTCSGLEISNGSALLSDPKIPKVLCKTVGPMAMLVAVQADGRGTSADQEHLWTFNLQQVFGCPVACCHRPQRPALLCQGHVYVKDTVLPADEVHSFRHTKRTQCPLMNTVSSQGTIRDFETFHITIDRSVEVIGLETTWLCRGLGASPSSASQPGRPKARHAPRRLEMVISLICDFRFAVSFDRPDLESRWTRHDNYAIEVRSLAVDVTVC